MSRKKKANVEMLDGSAVRPSYDYDYWILILVLALVLFGVVMVFSAGYYQTVSQSDPDPYYYLKRQGFFASTGFVLMFIASRIDYYRYEKLWPLILLVSIAGLVVVLTPLGDTINGAARYITIAGIRITPSEISKLAMILVTSIFIARNPLRVKKLFGGVMPIFIVMGIHAILIMRQPNLSTAVVVCAIMFGIMFVGGLSIWYTGVIALGLAGGTV